MVALNHAKKYRHTIYTMGLVLFLYFWLIFIVLLGLNSSTPHESSIVGCQVKDLSLPSGGSSTSTLMDDGVVNTSLPTSPVRIAISNESATNVRKVNHTVQEIPSCIVDLFGPGDVRVPVIVASLTLDMNWFADFACSTDLRTNHLILIENGVSVWSREIFDSLEKHEAIGKLLHLIKMPIYVGLPAAYNAALHTIFSLDEKLAEWFLFLSPNAHSSNSFLFGASKVFGGEVASSTVRWSDEKREADEVFEMFAAYRGWLQCTTGFPCSTEPVSPRTVKVAPHEGMVALGLVSSSMEESSFFVSRTGAIMVGFFDENFFPFSLFLLDWQRRCNFLGLKSVSFGEGGVTRSRKPVSGVQQQLLFISYGRTPNLMGEDMSEVYFLQKWDSVAANIAEGFATPFNIPQLPPNAWVIDKERIEDIVEASEFLSQGMKLPDYQDELIREAFVSSIL